MVLDKVGLSNYFLTTTAEEANKLFALKSRKNPRRKKQQNFIEQAARICQNNTMLILIDGYNLIRQSDTLRNYERQSLEEGRRALIAKLIEYEKRRGHKITVVFDGWKNGSADEGRDRAGKINIIYSRHGEKADDVIKRIAAHTAEDTIVVSSDREIASYITRCGRTALTSLEFEAIMNKVISPSPGSNYAEEKQDENPDRQNKKKGPARRLPRAKRQAQTKINKL